MAVFDDDGPGPNQTSLFVSVAAMRLHEQPVPGIARWDGKAWHTLGDGLQGPGIATSASALCAFDEDGEGPNPGGL